MQKFPYLLFGLLIPLIIWSGISPVDRANWWAEIIPIFMVFGVFVFTFKRFRFSNIAYGFAFVWLVLHTIGSHYTFALVPFDWFGDVIGSQRNHFDRMAHFSIGFYAFVIAEWVDRKKWIEYGWTLIFFALFAIISLAGIYEVIEWAYAVAFGGERADDFLGSQGDIWDAQKDILADTLGAMFSLCFYPFSRKVKG